jgi:hypothetical protein
MRQNIGLVFLTLGSVLLSICVFPSRLIGSWKDYPWEQRWFLKMLGEKEFFENLRNRDEHASRMEKDEKYARRVKRWARIRADYPIIAIVMMLIGFFLCFNYSAF